MSTPSGPSRSLTTDARILAALRKAGPGAVSSAELSQSLGISDAAIWARIEELRKVGYDIAAGPHSGYRLISAPDALHADDLLARVGNPRLIGRDIRVFETTTSTSDVIEKLARDGVGEGVVVFAEAQTRGRGRLGRKWVSPARKGLWFSVLLRPDIRPQETTQLTIAAAVALVRAIRAETRLEAEVKWPNDILLRGRKTAGILTELSAELDRVKHVILGIGVDVNVAEADYPAELRSAATSIGAEAGRSISRPDLAATLLRELDNACAQVHSGGFPAIADEWESCCSTLGRSVSICIGSRTVRGRAEALDDDGALLVRTEHGHLERIIGGDVTTERGT